MIMSHHLPSFNTINNILSPQAVVESITKGRLLPFLPPELPFSYFTDDLYNTRTEKQELGSKSTLVPGAAHERQGTEIHIQPRYRHAHPFYNRGKYDGAGRLMENRTGRTSNMRGSFHRGQGNHIPYGYTTQVSTPQLKTGRV